MATQMTVNHKEMDGVTKPRGRCGTHQSCKQIRCGIYNWRVVVWEVKHAEIFPSGEFISFI